MFFIRHMDTTLRKSATLTGALMAALAASTIAPAPLEAQPGGPAAALLPANARIASMANTGLVSADGDAALSNPAVLPNARGSALSFHRLSHGSNYGSFGIVQTIASYFVGFGVQHIESGAGSNPYQRDPTDEDGGTLLPAASAQPRVTGTSFTLGAARIWKGIRFGAGARYSSDIVGTDQYNGFTFDAGAARQISRGALTVAARNFGANVQVNGGKMEPAHSVGAAYGLFTRPVAEFLDAGGQIQLTAEGSDWFVRPAAAGEIGYVPIQGISFFVRAGVRAVRDSSESRFTSGLGLNYDSYSIDYAFEPSSGNRSAVHRIGFRVR